MLKQILVGTGLIVTGMVAMAAGLHYGDSNILDAIKQDLDDVAKKAKEGDGDVSETIDQFVEINRPAWEQDLNMASSLKELDALIAKARKG